MSFKFKRQALKIINGESMRAVCFGLVCGKQWFPPPGTVTCDFFLCAFLGHPGCFHGALILSFEKQSRMMFLKEG